MNFNFKLTWQMGFNTLFAALFILLFLDNRGINTRIANLEIVQIEVVKAVKFLLFQRGPQNGPI